MDAYVAYDAFTSCPRCTLREQGVAAEDIKEEVVVRVRDFLLRMRHHR